MHPLNSTFGSLQHFKNTELGLLRVSPEVVNIFLSCVTTLINQ